MCKNSHWFMCRLGFSFCVFFFLLFYEAFFALSQLNVGVINYGFAYDFFQSIRFFPIYSVWNVLFLCVYCKYLLWMVISICCPLWLNWKINPVLLSIIYIGSSHLFFSFYVITVNYTDYVSLCVCEFFRYLIIMLFSFIAIEFYQTAHCARAYQSQSIERHLYRVISSKCLFNCVSVCVCLVVCVYLRLKEGYCINAWLLWGGRRLRGIRTQKNIVFIHLSYFILCYSINCRTGFKFISLALNLWYICVHCGYCCFVTCTRFSNYNGLLPINYIDVIVSNYIQINAFTINWSSRNCSNP